MPRKFQHARTGGQAQFEPEGPRRPVSIGTRDTQTTASPGSAPQSRAAFTNSAATDGSTLRRFRGAILLKSGFRPKALLRQRGYTATWSMVMRLNAFFCGTVELARLRLGPKSKLIRGQIRNISLSAFARITYLQPDEACQISYLGYGD